MSSSSSSSIILFSFKHDYWLAAAIGCVCACFLAFCLDTTVSAVTAPSNEAKLPSPEVSAPETEEVTTPTVEVTDDDDANGNPPAATSTEETLSSTQDTGIANSESENLDPGYGEFSRPACLNHINTSSLPA